MDTVTIVRDLGLPVALLLGLFWGLYQGTCWFGQKVVIPLQERHLLFLDKLEKAMEQIADTQSKLAHEIERLSQIGCGYRSNPGGGGGKISNN